MQPCQLLIFSFHEVSFYFLYVSFFLLLFIYYYFALMLVIHLCDFNFWSKTENNQSLWFGQFKKQKRLLMSEKARIIRNVLIRQSLNSCFLFFYSFKSGVESEIFLSYNFSLTFVFVFFNYYYFFFFFINRYRFCSLSCKQVL